jgi:hypothetical protein
MLDLFVLFLALMVSALIGGAVVYAAEKVFE